MDAQTVIDRIHAARSTGVKHGLDNMRRLLQKLDIHPGVPVIHVAGTNGKGSTCVCLAAILRAAGYRTGLYTSPFLENYAERIRLGGTPIGESDLARLGGRVLEAAEELEAEGVRATPFELGTALAALAFSEPASRLDAWILETGMGGRLDATTAIPATLCAITPVGMDHKAYLGDTLSDIAREKAGILRPGIRCVTAPQAEEAMQAIRRGAEVCGASLVPAGTVLQVRAERHRTEAVIRGRETYRVTLPLPGAHQAVNAAVAITLAEQLREAGLAIGREDMERGLSEAVWPGRLEWQGRCLLDGAHNPPAVQALGAYVRDCVKEEKVLLTAVMADKDTDALARGLAGLARRAVCVPLAGSRALDPGAFRERLEREGVEAVTAPGVEDGFDLAVRLAGERGCVLCTGSLYLVGEVRSLLKRRGLLEL